jgi:hypothetical protein
MEGDGICPVIEGVERGPEMDGEPICPRTMGEAARLEREGEFVCLENAGEAALLESVVLREGGWVIVPLRYTDGDQRASHR